MKYSFKKDRKFNKDEEIVLRYLEEKYNCSPLTFADFYIIKQLYKEEIEFYIDEYGKVIIKSTEKVVAYVDTSSW